MLRNREDNALNSQGGRNRGPTTRWGGASPSFLYSLVIVIAIPLRVWEQALDDIAEGKMSLEDFMAKQSAWTAQLVEKGRLQAINITVPPSP